MTKNGSKNAPMQSKFFDTIVDSVVLVDHLQLSASVLQRFSALHLKHQEQQNYITSCATESTKMRVN